MKQFYLSVLVVLFLGLMAVDAYAQRMVSGTVSDAGGPLPGVSVLVKGTNKGTTTNPEGVYSLEAAPSDVLVFSMIGYVKKEVTVADQISIQVVLEEDAAQLNEVVVTAMGIKRDQKALGYSVSTISSKQLTEAGNTNIGSALYGKAAGVKITTAPGGASSAVNVQIRGINSLNYNQQPLYVVDGVMVRNDNQNGAAGANNDGFYSDQRIRGNGALDINPNDIESMSILKGASATALYGSDASSGVIVITTKKGSKDRGLGVDFNYNGSIENAAFLPKFQNIYGPGYDRETNIANGATADGWIADEASPSGYRPYFRSYGSFGPKMDGQDVLWWDGSIRSYTARPDNFKDIYRTGYNSNLNLAISNQTDKVNYRLSATRMDYRNIQEGSDQNRNTFNLNSSVKLSDKVSADVVVNYVNTNTHNRPYLLGQVLGDFGGFFSRTEDMSLMKEKFQTADGYKYSVFDDRNSRPDRFPYAIRASNLLDFYWQQMRNSYDETENRLYSSATLNWQILDNLKFRGRIGNDYTGVGIENKQYSEYPSYYNTTNSTGGYSVSQGQYSILYGDVLLTYNNKIGEDIDFSVSGGYQGRSENFKDQYASTYLGLVSENWFSLSNSFGNPRMNEEVKGTRKELLKYAYLGILNMSYKDYLFIEGTARQEYASTLPVKNNSYFYPSVNGSFVFTEAFKLPSFVDYGKIRASYGVVGNAPPMYEANILYNQTSLQTVNGSVPALSMSGKYGNDNLKPEMKYESEFGLEARFLQSRLGFDVSYYNNRVKDQILQLTTSTTTGARSQIVNVGEIGSYGVELALNGSPLVGNFRWDTRFNFAINRSKVISLMDGLDRLQFYDAEQSGIKMYAEVGETLGNIYVNPIATDASGNKLINNDGLYVIDKSTYVKAGNIMPKVVGGWSNTLGYKSFSLDFTIDYRLGGQMISNPTKYMRSAGLLENTLEYRDTEHGGLTYTLDGNTYHDGVLLDGVNENTGEANGKIIQAATYYMNTFGWGADADNGRGSVYDNSYVKLREAVLSYRIPVSFSDKLHLNNLRVSLIGRNLFYLWRTLENVDPEAPIGNKWWSQGVDIGTTAATRSFGFSINANF